MMFEEDGLLTVECDCPMEYLMDSAALERCLWPFIPLRHRETKSEQLPAKPTSRHPGTDATLAAILELLCLGLH